MKKTGMIAFIVVFCVLALLPFAANAVSPKAPLELDYNTPAINMLEEHKCIEDTEFMKSSHMQLLDQWRNDVVRNGDIVYTATDGTKYEKSLDDTCLACHSNPEDFCDRCHTYEGVEPFCWDCHNSFGLWREDANNEALWQDYVSQVEGGQQ